MSLNNGDTSITLEKPIHKYAMGMANKQAKMKIHKLFIPAPLTNFQG